MLQWESGATMPETITLLSGISVPVGSQVTEVFSIPYHENPVTINMVFRPVGAGYRCPTILIDGQAFLRYLTGMPQNVNKTIDLTAGTHSITVKTDPGTRSPYGTGPYVFTVTATYEPAEGPAIPELDLLPILIITGVGIVIAAGAWLLTDGFTKMPKLPFIELPF